MEPIISVAVNMRGHQTHYTASEQDFGRVRGDIAGIHIKLCSEICEDNVPRVLVC